MIKKLPFLPYALADTQRFSVWMDTNNEELTQVLHDS